VPDEYASTAVKCPKCQVLVDRSATVVVTAPFPKPKVGKQRRKMMVGASIAILLVLLFGAYLVVKLMAPSIPPEEAQFIAKYKKALAEYESQKDKKSLGELNSVVADIGGMNGWVGKVVSINTDVDSAKLEGSKFEFLSYKCVLMCDGVTITLSDVALVGSEQERFIRIREAVRSLRPEQWVRFDAINRLDESLEDANSDSYQLSLSAHADHIEAAR